MADPQTLLLSGLAQVLAEAGVGNWSPGAVPASEALPLIVLRALPERPERVISLTDYGQVLDGRLTDATISVNVRLRGTRSPGDVAEMAWGVASAWHALGRRLLPSGIDVVDVQWSSEAQLGPDGAGRHERSVNYTVRWNVPGQPRLD